MFSLKKASFFRAFDAWVLGLSMLVLYNKKFLKNEERFVLEHMLNDKQAQYVVLRTFTCLRVRFTVYGLRTIALLSFFLK